MEPRNEVAEPRAATCPLHDLEPELTEEPGQALTPTDELTFPRHKRMFAQYRTNESGTKELILYYADNQISFDEPELFGFGEGLAQHARFAAGDATGWGSGYEWARVRDLLQELVATGVLLRATAPEADPPLSRDLNRPSLLPAASLARPRTWHECEAITQEMTGRSLPLGYLESILPPYRIAHAALDGEDRQVGEANVFPPELRLDVTTEWRACPHAGSRYQDELPMNVTALKSMRAHWKQMMVAILRVREAYLRRFPEAARGWTIGDLHCLSAFVLSIPSYLTMRTHGRIENGQLHPVLSSMYRVTDGVRMVMHHMLFSANLEPTLPMTTPMTSVELLAFAERNRIFHSDYGVCAGPPAMIDEFLRVLIDGQAIENAAHVVLDAPIAAALDDIEAAFDYVLLGLQSYSVWSSRWPPMVRTYEEVFTVLEGWSAPRTAAFERFHARLSRSITFLRNATRHNTEDRRERREGVYADMYARSVRALGAHDAAPLADAIAPVPMADDAQVRRRLRSELQQRLCGASGGVATELEHLTDAVLDYLRRERAIVRKTARIQSRINQLLGRTPPARALTGADLAIHHRILGSIYRPEVLAKVDGRLPYIVDELADELGLAISVASERIDIASG